MGYFAQANGGTLFTDEIAEIPIGEQAKFLRAIELGEIQSLGAARPGKYDIRVIAATNRNLLRMVQENQFREDLYHRIASVTIDLPPLTRRKGDIEVLTGHFLAKFAAQSDLPVKRIAESLIVNYEGRR